MYDYGIPNCVPEYFREKFENKYILKYDFNSNLIEKIAMDTGCKNERLIHAVKEHFGEIALRR